MSEQFDLTVVRLLIRHCSLLPLEGKKKVPLDKRPDNSSRSAVDLEIVYIFRNQMIYITQLIYIKQGKEDIFNQFEAVAIPAIARYDGQLLLRMRPAKEDIIESGIEPPYEVHLVCFPSDDDFERFKNDDERRQFLHLKDESVTSMLLIKGSKI